jgi:hypothetical protein
MFVKLPNYTINDLFGRPFFAFTVSPAGKKTGQGTHRKGPGRRKIQAQNCGRITEIYNEKRGLLEVSGKGKKWESA